MDERNEHSEPIDERIESLSAPLGAEPVTPEPGEGGSDPGAASPPEPDVTADLEAPAELATGEFPPSVTRPWIPLPTWQPGPYAGPGPAPGIGPDPGPGQPPRRHRGRIIAAMTAAALLLVGAGAGIAVALSGSASPRVTMSAVSTNSSPRSGTTLRTSQIAQRLDPAVVDINTVVELPGGNAEAAGTGMIVSSNGYILTNNHVVEQATSIQVSIPGRGRYTATFVGADPSADVAVIKVHGLQGLPTVTFGNSSTLAVGDPVVAIGNALGLGGSPTVSTGIVSALGRSITASDSTGSSEHLSGMIQTDAPIEPGNSGGPLVDAAGHVIGMDTAAASAAGSGSSLGFALPINRVAGIASEIEHGTHAIGVVLGLPAFLGIDGQDVNLLGQQTSTGVNIVDVIPGTPAAQAGIQPGDVILKFDGTSTPTIQDLAAQIHRLRPGQAATVTYESQFGTRTVTVHLIQGPAA